MDAKLIANSFDGLMSMSSEHTEVRLLLQELTKQINASEDELPAGIIGNILYAMKSMSSEHEEVRDLLKKLKMKIKLASDELKK